MNREAKRFVALNAVLHGHDVLNVFDDSLPEMADCLDLSEEAAKKLVDGLRKEKPADATDDLLVATFLNFYRNETYAFVAMENTPIPLRTFAQGSMDGSIEADLCGLFLHQMIRDVERGDQYVEPSIRDGVLCCTPEDLERAEDCMLEAYKLYTEGPSGTTKQLAKLLRKYTSLQEYNKLSAKDCVKVLSLLERSAFSPVAFQRTMLQTPDLFGTYKLTGAVMCFTDNSEETVCWLLDAEYSEEYCHLVEVPTSTVTGLAEEGKGKLSGVIGCSTGIRVVPVRKR